MQPIVPGSCFNNVAGVTFVRVEEDVLVDAISFKAVPTKKRIRVQKHDCSRIVYKSLFILVF